jgi:hypothetical protein
MRFECVVTVIRTTLSIGKEVLDGFERSRRPPAF